MKKLLLLMMLLSVCSQGQTNKQQNYEFTNGQWFDGQRFVAGRFYSVGGRLTTKRPARIDKTFDLTGRFVVPPFGEAHNHNVEAGNAAEPDRFIRMYLEAGIFYVKNPNILPRVRAAVAGKVNRPTSVDAVFANGGLTGTNGHPWGMVRRNIERNIFAQADGEGGFLFTIDSEADLDRRWETIKAGRPDFIKTYLLHSEEFTRRKTDATYFGWTGLDPAVLPFIVKRAHRDGLRVSTHIETATDFHYAVAAGVDEINHLPGFRPEQDDLRSYENLSRYEISEADARLAAEKNITVVTTLERAFDRINRLDPNRATGQMRDNLRKLFVRNLQLLARHKVKIAIGCDSYFHTAAREAMGLHRMKAFDNLTLLKMWCETTAETIFPRRKIGHLKEGYEASFLVLSGNPIEDFANVEKIEMRVKQGEILAL